jgi:predicted RNase H-like HicB family nuclease
MIGFRSARWPPRSERRRQRTAGESLRRYTVLLYPEPDEDGYAVVVPILPGCVTQGNTVEEALANARTAIEDYPRTSRALGDESPDEPIPPAVVTVELPDEPPPCDPEAKERQWLPMTS